MKFLSTILTFLPIGQKKNIELLNQDLYFIRLYISKKAHNREKLHFTVSFITLFIAQESKGRSYRRRWLKERMENNANNANSHESQTSEASNRKTAEKVVFVNHAEIAWQSTRREWVGDQSNKTQRAPREPIMSWTTTYEDLLLSTEPFQQRIPLAEMVDFLVDIWHEEGLFD